jgi:hypothetical protein
MSVVENDPLNEVLVRVNTWPPAQRITLARRILEALEPMTLTATPTPRGRPIEELLALFRTDRPAPDDETVRRWIDEHRMEKYGQ